MPTAVGAKTSRVALTESMRRGKNSMATRLDGMGRDKNDVKILNNATTFFWAVSNF